MNLDCEVAIVGAGPSGAACAYWLAQAGVSVVLLEKSNFPRAKTCGDGLTPRAVRQIFDMGLEATLSGRHRCVGLRSFAFGRELHLPWPSQNGYPEHGYIVARAELDHMVALQAEQAGAVFLQGHKVVSVQQETTEDSARNKIISLEVKRTSDDAHLTITAKYFVIAEGTKGRIGAMLGTQRNRSFPLGMAARRYYYSPRHTDTEMVSFLDITDEAGRALPAYGWIFPLGDGRINVGAGLLSTTTRWKSINTSQLLEAFVARLDASWDAREETACSAIEGGRLPTGLSVRPRTGANFVCVGDAAGAINPFNGEGISYAYETGRLAAGVISRVMSQSSPDLDDYETLLQKYYGNYYRFARMFVALMGKPQIMRICVQIGFRYRPAMLLVLRIMSNLVSKPIVFEDPKRNNP